MGRLVFGVLRSVRDSMDEERIKALCGQVKVETAPDDA
jgi:hypothetical protein